MNEDKTITMEIISFVRYKDECYEVGEVFKNLLNKLDEKNNEIERLNNIIKRLKEVLKENEELRLQLVNLRNNRVIFADTEEEYELSEGREKCKKKTNMSLQ